ncbi:hypothetical protein [Bacillus taeanensis]|uniref:Uncharacterized protein n=1 Tax=Bacillus taeanensis TaxID=273032 RepID=A0A366XZA8_9BACI|nr:hypothetical protein [Bacillus taeanensis]RBW69483.1 hypothetical protein DS031_11205 [Bacillus taeanensis]
MNKEQVIAALEERKLKDIIELIEDAEEGYLEELELVESVGLVYGDELNKAVLDLLQSLGVTLIYVTDDE